MTRLRPINAQVNATVRSVATIFRMHLQSGPNIDTAASANSDLLFPGQMPGQALADAAKIRAFYDETYLARAICQQLAGATISVKDIDAACQARCRELAHVLDDRHSVVARHWPHLRAGEPAAAANYTTAWPWPPSSASPAATCASPAALSPRSSASCGSTT